MPTAKYFNKCPPFPTTVATLDIPTISLIKLEQNEKDEFNRLFHACRAYGFFRLDLQESQSGRALLTHAEAMIDVGTETLSLGKEVLDEYAYNPPKDLLGYVQSRHLAKRPGSDIATKGDASQVHKLTNVVVLGTRPPARSKPTTASSTRWKCIPWAKTKHYQISQSARSRHRSRHSALNVATSSSAPAP